MTAWASSVSFICVACAALRLPVVAGTAVMAGRVLARDARLVAAQGIGDDAIGTIRPASLSQDGQLIAFVSRPTESPQRRCCQNVYVLDRSSGLMTQESINADGTRWRGDSQAPSLSSDGRIIAFETVASNPLPGDPRFGPRHVVVRDRRSGALLVPRSASGQSPDGESGEPSVSGNGLSLAFTSDATNLVSKPDTNGRQTDIYLWPLDRSAVSRISVATTGVQPPTGASYSPSVSHDGDRVAFVSMARLAADDSNDVADVYLRDVRRGLTTRVSRAMGSVGSDAGAHSPALSADGRYVAFVSTGSHRVPRHRDQETDVYLYEVSSGSIALVSAAKNGAAANAASRQPGISADGRRVVYQSLASNLGSGPRCARTAADTNLLPDVYLFDRITRCVARISGSPSDEWWTPSLAPAIDGSGTAVVFSSTQPVGESDLSTDFDLFLFIQPPRGAPTSREGA